MTTPEPKTEPTVAEALIDMRTRLGLSQSEASRNSGIPKKYIEFFESGSNDITPDVYARHKLRAYSNYLKLDAEKVIEAFQEENAQPVRHTEVRHASRWRKHPLKNIPLTRMIGTPLVVRAVVIGAVALSIGLFFVVRAHRMMAPPNISLLTPMDGLVTSERALTVEGHTEREVTLLVNGKPVYIDSEGNFQDDLNLREGLNVIHVVAIRKHGQESEVTRRVIVKPSERPTASLELYGPAK
jgi:transcriptional regulator with XRE-family HTH domain